MKCSFCGKSNRDVEQMISANNKIAICDRCIMLCLKILVYSKPDPITIELKDDEKNESIQADSRC